MEFNLLRLLAENAGAVVSRDRIMEVVYANAGNMTDRAIDAHIARIRKKLETEVSSESLIRTVHREGYTLATTATFE